MIQSVMFDLRPDDIHTHAELDSAMEGRLQECRSEFDAFVPVAIVLHESQIKWLKLEKFEREHIPSAKLKKMKMDNWKGIQIFAVDDWELMPCPNCGKLHDDGDEWYDGE